MGPNGTGKSTLANVLAGKDNYTVTEGSATFNDTDLITLENPEDRAHAGLFLAFQYPVELPGVNIAQFLKASINAHRHAHGVAPLDAVTFLKKVKEKMALLNIDDAILKRNVNEGFSGGEKKRFETLQMALLEPQLCILDETDSGLDIDALKIVANGVNSLRNSARTFVIITHYNRLLELITPDNIHIMKNGKIVTSGGMELLDKLEDQGYESFAA